MGLWLQGEAEEQGGGVNLRASWDGQEGTPATRKTGQRRWSMQQGVGLDGV